MKAFRTSRAMIACTFLAIVCTSCSKQIVGNWKTDPEPKDEPFYITSATFKDDGTYTAVARHRDAVEPLRGTYEFTGMELKLKTPGKQDRTYKATYLMVGPKLELRAEGKKISMKKQ